MKLTPEIYYTYDIKFVQPLRITYKNPEVIYENSRGYWALISTVYVMRKDKVIESSEHLLHEYNNHGINKSFKPIIGWFDIKTTHFLSLTQIEYKYQDIRNMFNRIVRKLIEEDFCVPINQDPKEFIIDLDEELSYKFDPYTGEKLYPWSS